MYVRLLENRHTVGVSLLNSTFDLFSNISPRFIVILVKYLLWRHKRKVHRKLFSDDIQGMLCLSFDLDDCCSCVTTDRVGFF